MEGEATAVKRITEKLFIKKISLTWLATIAAIVASTLTVLTWLYVEAEAVSPQAHIQYTQQMRILREVNAKIDAEILALRMELSRNYDALTSYETIVYKTSAITLISPKFLLKTDSEKLTLKAKSLNQSFQQKATQIDIFKRYNAILLNSLSYFQKTAGDFTYHQYNTEISQHQYNTEISQQVERYIRHTLFYIRNQDIENIQPYQQSKHTLQALKLSPDQQSIIENLLVHGNLIFNYIPEVNRQMRSIFHSTISNQLSELNNIYLTGHKNAQKRAQSFRNLLYLFAVILTAYLAFTFFKLYFTRRSLATAHREVTRRYLAQKKAEQSLLLHDTAFNSAHEGITLTDKKGKILEVNPAFTRITGFEREEVLGRNPRVLKSGRHDERFYQSMWKSINETGKWRGEIWNRNKYGEIYPEILSITTVKNTQKEVTNYVAVFSDISRIKKQENQLRKMAYYDSLTDLPNRVLFTDRIQQAMSQTLRSKTFMAVCFLDLDGFKPINDSFGHEAGDKLLIELANRFKEELRGGDTVARLGGDEFVFLYVGLEKLEEYDSIVQRLMLSISKNIQIKSETINISASIGVTIYPKDNSDADTLLRHADQSMYLAKQKGKNCFHLFDPDLDYLARSKHKQIFRIEEALLNNEMSLYYQPKVNLREGKIVGFEALLRWIHPQQGLTPPLEFLPLIEDDELIVQLGKFVIKTTLEQLESWYNQGFETSVSVNVASRQLQNPNFVTDLKQVLSEHPVISPKNLELEVLETAALEDIVSVSRIIKECSELGVKTSLDDFGTGYSSLTYLKRLPTSTLKIDQSFVRDMMNDPENLAIVQGILGLTRAFKKQVIAEGMETSDHGRMLIQLGCNYAQGYGIAKPMPAKDVVSWKDSWKPDPIYSSIRQLTWVDADYPMFSAEVGHNRLISLLVNAIENNQPIIHTNLGDYHHCCLGQWYYDEGLQRYGDYPEFQKLESSHKHVHLVAEEIDQYYRDGKIDQAKTLIPGLLQQQQHVLARLNALNLSVAQRLSTIEVKPYKH